MCRPVAFRDGRAGDGALSTDWGAWAEWAARCRQFGGRSRAASGVRGPGPGCRGITHLLGAGVAYLGWPPRRACVTLTDTARRTAPHGPATHSGQG